MYFLVDNDPNLRFECAEDLVEEYVTADNIAEDEEQFDEMLSECYSDYEVYGNSFSARDTLINFGVYEETLQSWAEDKEEELRADAIYDLEHLSNGETTYVLGHRVYAYEEDEEEEVVVFSASQLVDALRSKINSQNEEETKEQQEICSMKDAYFQMLSA